MTQNRFCFLFKLKSSLSFDNLATHNTCETTHLDQGKTCTGAHKNCMHCEMHIYTYFVRILSKYHEICMAHKLWYAYEVQIMRNNEKFRQTEPIKLSNMLTKIDT